MGPYPKKPDSSLVDRMRISLVAASLVVTLLVAAPVASAATIKFSFDSPHAEMPIPDDGTRSHPITVLAHVRDFVCIRDAKVSVEAVFAQPFEKWAGASINPRLVTFSIAATEPGSGEKKLVDQRVTLEVDWNVDDRPRMGAVQTYEIDFKKDPPPAIQDGPCTPPPTLEWGPVVKVTAHMPDIVEETPVIQDCNVAPDLPECQATAAPTVADGKAPGFEALLFGLALAGALALRRRRP